MSFLPVKPVFGRRGDIDGTRVLPHPSITWETRRMSWRAVGGPHRADLRAECDVNHVSDLLDYLRNGVRLYDAQSEQCWHGYVHEVRARWGVTEIGISLDRMFNRIKVKYQTLSPGEDATEDATTDWAEDAISVSQYGDKELILDAGSLVLSLDGAEALRDTRLARVSVPSAVANYEGRGVARPVVDMLCRGWWDTLSWVHYSQDAGRISYTDTDGGAVQGIGQNSFNTAADVTWDDHPEGDFIYSVSGQFLRYSAGQIIVVTNALDNAIDNNGTYTIVERNINGQRLTVAEDVDDNGTGNSITITPQGLMAAESFMTGPNDDWDIVSLSVRAWKVGSPSDTLRISLYSDDGSGNPDGSVVEGEIDAADIDGVVRWRKALPSASYTMVPLTEYHVVVDRTGADDPANCYHVELSTDAGYSGGAYKYWNGLTWATRSGVDMPFDIVGGYAASTLIKQTLEESEFVTEVTVVDAGRALAVLTQIEEQTVKSVIEGLLETGTSNDRRLLADVDLHRAVTIFEEPSVDAPATLYRRGRDGVIRDRNGAKVEPQRSGVLAGKWLESEDMQAIVAPSSDLADAGRAMLEEVEWTLSGDAVRLTARGAKNVWEL